MKQEKIQNTLRGKVLHNEPLGAQSWFRCGGVARELYEPAYLEDLQYYLSALSEPPVIIGGMANTIVRDGGILTPALRLGKEFASVRVEGDHVIAGAGALNGTLSAAAMKAGLGGLEFLSGIPGTLGGAVAMNAGAYGAEMRDVLVAAEFVLADGTLAVFTPQELSMRYRYTELPQGAVCVGATLRGVQEGYEAVKARMNDIKKKRNETQPIKEKTGGSTFANPSAEELAAAGLPEITRAWQLVERVGGRGLTIGGAQMSEKHCNFMVNAGGATASDLEDLGDELIRRVHEETGVRLRWEIKRTGVR